MNSCHNQLILSLKDLATILTIVMNKLNLNAYGGNYISPKINEIILGTPSCDLFTATCSYNLDLNTFNQKEEEISPSYN